MMSLFIHSFCVCVCVWKYTVTTHSPLIYFMYCHALKIKYKLNVLKNYEITIERISEKSNREIQEVLDFKQVILVHIGLLPPLPQLQTMILNRSLHF